MYFVPPFLRERDQAAVGIPIQHPIELVLPSFEAPRCEEVVDRAVAQPRGDQLESLRDKWGLVIRKKNRLSRFVPSHSVAN
jgi:hypothetical protein